MNKSSEIYGHAWDIAAVIDNLEQYVCPVLNQLSQNPDAVSEAEIELATLTLKSTVETLKSSVSDLEESSFQLEEMFDELGIPDPDEPDPKSRLS